ncbi:MAG: carboxypeptidase-like regulatory domain-containing protein [Bryobacteraceae bacterium]|jgi:hypothetical protein
MRNSWLLKTLAGLLCSSVLLCAQKLTWYERWVLLETPRSVSGVVVDPSGKPIAGAHIDHTDVKEQEKLFTDDQGHFQFQTGAPAIVVRKLGFSGERVRIQGTGPLRVVLRPATRTMPACTSTCAALKSADSVFCLPSVPGVEASEQGRYADSMTQVYKITTKDGQRELLHGAGPVWTLGVPYTGDVWESPEYTENAYLLGDSDVVDARGKMPDGKLWRYLGRFGESVSYYEVDASGAALLDKVLDGVCAR